MVSGDPCERVVNGSKWIMTHRFRITVCIKAPGVSTLGRASQWSLRGLMPKNPRAPLYLLCMSGLEGSSTIALLCNGVLWGLCHPETCLCTLVCVPLSCVP